MVIDSLTARYITPLAFDQTESEVLFLPGTEFVVDQFDRSDDGLITIRLIEVPR